MSWRDLQCLATVPVGRRLGAGTVVVEELTRLAASLGARAVFCAVMVNNKASLGLFDRLGHETKPPIPLHVSIDTRRSGSRHHDPDRNRPLNPVAGAVVGASDLATPFTRPSIEAGARSRVTGGPAQAQYTMSSE